MKIAAMSSETRTRVITGVAGGALLLTVVIAGGYWGVALLSAIMAAAMCFEMAKVFYHLPDKKEKTHALLGVAWLSIFANILSPKSILEATLLSFIGLFAYYLFSAERYNYKAVDAAADATRDLQSFKQHFNEFVATVFIYVYIVLFCAFLPLIRDGASGSHWLLLFLIICWAGDTGAYFIGKKYGKQKLYPLISPGKTVEGSLGGLGCSLLLTILYKLLFLNNMTVLGMFITPIVVGATAQLGDLCESFFKRAYGLKDSGSVLPGHGGMLDRFDGVLFSIPVMYICVKLFSS